MESGPLTTSDVNVAVVGVGYWGKNLVRNFHELGALAALCDAERSVEATLQAAVRGRQVLPRLQRRPGRSVDRRRGAGDAGGDALRDGQGGARSRQGRARRKAAGHRRQARRRASSSWPRRTGRILMVGHILRYHPAILKLQELIRERRARQDQLPLFEPAEHRQDPDRREHPLELRAARHLRDAVAARRDAEPRSPARAARI